MLSVLATGTLVADPKERTSGAGRPYVTASLRVATEDESILVSAVAFSDSARQALAALSRGDSAAVTGKAKLTSWEKDGETRFGVSVLAETVLTHYQLEKRRKRAAAADAGEDGVNPIPRPDRAVAGLDSSQAGNGSRELPAIAGGVADMDDDLPF